MPKKEVQNFIPIACHYDDHTLLTKNGELVQVIRLWSKDEDTDELHNDVDLVRNSVRQALAKVIKSASVMVYCYTIRNYEYVTNSDIFLPHHSDDNKLTEAERDEIFNLLLGALDTEAHKEYRNRFYIAIVHKGSKDLTGYKRWLDSLSGGRLANIWWTKIANKAALLDNIMTELTEALEHLHTKRLGIMEMPEHAYSELLSFYRYLVGMSAFKVELRDVDASAEVGAGVNISRTFNTMSVEHAGKTKKAAVYSLKFPWHSLHNRIAADITGTELSFVISEAIQLTSYNMAKSAFLAAAGLIGYEPEKVKATSMLHDNSKAVSYCVKQTTIVLHADSKEELGNGMSEFSKICDNLGLGIVLEDLYMEAAFWSILPGNAHLLKRMRATTLESAANFLPKHSVGPEEVVSEL